MAGGHDLSHIKYEGSGDHSNDRVAILVSKWNEKITGALLQGAKATLLDAKVKEENIKVYFVPGSYELSSAANMVLEAEKLDGVICLGCVIQGETRHFDFICEAVAQGITNVSIKHNR
ncbi:MAG: 6,7-dimethyl-8-ribityllumazine synthase, partial [Bacteroidota bacterium]